LGRKLIDRYFVDEPTSVIGVYSRDESKHWTIKNDLSGGPLEPQLKRLQFFVGDVRDIGRVHDAVRQFRPTTVIIAAALKHVDTCELSPDESVKTNLLGTQNVINVINASQHWNYTKPGQVLFVSTDKACAPVNVYGMCKAISERLVTSQVVTGNPYVKFLAVRYGNVLESRGSIIPLFKHQSLHGDFITVTDPVMTRYCMTLDNSVDLIQSALQHGTSGETWIPRLPAMRIGDLAEIFSQKYGKPIKIIGLRPGEKQHEDLINESESVRAEERGDKHYVIGPAFKAGEGSRWTYSSDDNVMNKNKLIEHLKSLNILDAPLESFKGLSIEEIATNRKE